MLLPCLSFDALKLGRSFAFKLAQQTAVHDPIMITGTSKATQQPTAKTGLNG